MFVASTPTAPEPMLGTKDRPTLIDESSAPHYIVVQESRAPRYVVKDRPCLVVESTGGNPVGTSRENTPGA